MKKSGYIDGLRLRSLRSLVFYLTVITLSIVMLLSFTSSYRRLTFHKKLVSDMTSAFNTFKMLTGQINNVAVLNPNLNITEGSLDGSGLFHADSSVIKEKIRELRRVSKDKQITAILDELDTKVTAQLPWLLRSSVPDSIVEKKAVVRLAEFRKIHDLLDRGSSRAELLIRQEDKMLNEAIDAIAAWMVVFIAVAIGLLVFTGYNILSQNVKGERRFRLLIENSESIIALLDNDLKAFYRSPSVERIAGYKVDEKIDALHPADKARVAECLNKVKAVAGTTEFITYRLRHKAGHYIWLEGTFSNLLHEPGINAVVGNFIEVTEQKRSEALLRQTAQEFSAYKYALDESAIVAITDQKGLILHVNDNFCKISKYSREELIGKDHRIINSSFHEKAFIRSIWETIANGRIWQGELRNKAKDGSLYWVDTTIVPFLNEAGKPYRYIAIRSDITERKQAEIMLKELNEILQKRAKELAVSNAELEQFAYVASHDLQEPLRMITSFLSQLEQKYGNVVDERGKKYIHFAVDGAKRMRQIILDLLEFSRAGRSEDNISDVDINEVITNILTLYRKQIEEKQASITFGKLPVIKGFAAPLRQVFQNLISNSLKYQFPGKPAVISISHIDKGDDWLFEITDNGIGIDPEYFEKIFIIFQRLHNKETYSGTGMGLAITKKIIENLGGKIWVESSEGNGSTFYFTIPKT